MEKKDNLASLEACILPLGYKSLNNRVYSLEIGQRIIEQINEKREVFGTIGVARDVSQLDLSEISHVAKHPFIKEGKVFCEINVLDTPKGRKLKEMLKTVVFRVSGTGEVDGSGKITNYNLVSIDAINIDGAFQEREGKNVQTKSKTREQQSL